MQGYMEMKSLTSSQGAVPLRSLYDLSHLLGTLGRISITRLHTGWTTSIWCPSTATNTWLLSFIRTQSRVITGLLTRHLYVLGLSSNPTCRKCVTEEETSVHILCECEALATLKPAYLGSFFSDPEDVTNKSMGAIWTLVKEQASFNLVSEYGAQRACLRRRWIGPTRAQTQILFYSILHINI